MFQRIFAPSWRFPRLIQWNSKFQHFHAFSTSSSTSTSYSSSSSSSDDDDESSSFEQDMEDYDSIIDEKFKRREFIDKQMRLNRSFKLPLEEELDEVSDFDESDDFQVSEMSAQEKEKRALEAKRAFERKKQASKEVRLRKNKRAAALLELKGVGDGIVGKTKIQQKIVEAHKLIMNERITHKILKVIGEDGKLFNEAAERAEIFEYAKKANLELLQVGVSGSRFGVAIVRLVKPGYRKQLLEDLGKERQMEVQLKRDAMNQEKKRKNEILETNVKEIRLSAATGTHDTNTVIKKTIQWLEKKSAVILTLDFKSKNKKKGNDTKAEIDASLKQKSEEILTPLKGIARQFQDVKSSNRRRVYYFVHVDPEKCPPGLRPKTK
jgi:translation initiation factor IF-3